MILKMGFLDEGKFRISWKANVVTLLIIRDWGAVRLDA
jgi:hypothetical protein